MLQLILSLSRILILVSTHSPATALYLIDTDRGGPGQPNDSVSVANHIPQIYALDFRIIQYLVSNIMLYKWIVALLRLGSSRLQVYILLNMDLQFN